MRTAPLMKLASRSRAGLGLISVVALASTLLHATPARADESGGMRSPVAFGLGLLFSGIGGVGLGVGAHFYGKGEGACDGISMTSIPTATQIDACTTGVAEQAGGVVGMVAGGAFLLAGVPMTIAGAIPEDPKSTVSVSVNPTGGTLTLRF